MSNPSDMPRSSDYWLAQAADKRMSAALSQKRTERRQHLKQADTLEGYAKEDDEIDAAFDGLFNGHQDPDE